MKTQKCNPFVLAVVVLLCRGLEAQAAVSGDNEIESVSVQGVGKFGKVIVQSTRALKYREVSEKGMGVTLYMLEPVVCRRPALERTFSEIVSEIRYGYREGKAPASGEEARPLEFIRLVFKQPTATNIVQQEWVLAVELRPAPEGTVAGGGARGPKEVVSEEEKGSESARKTLPKSPLLKDFLTVGLANHRPLRVAEEESRVANVRYLEAMRNLLPAVTWKYSESEGELLEDPLVSTDDTKFKRKEIGVEFGIPLFHSGRNYFNFRSAGAQKIVAEQNVRKVQGEITFEITRAYYNLVRSQRAVKARRDLSRRSEKIIELARKKKQLGLITPSDYLGADSLFNQGVYRLLSDEKDLEIARLKMAGYLNISEALPEILTDPADAVNVQHLVDLSVPPESLIATAYEQRPEMRVAENTAVAQRYSYRAAWAQNLLKVDGTYFTGDAGGAFEDKPLELRNSWNAGVQASLYFGGSTVRGAMTDEHTVPDYSETTATDVKGKTASVGLFDSLKSAGDARQARAGRDRALHEFEQARRDVQVDVREAYYNIQKAKIQIRGAQSELDYREKELDITQQKERMNMVEPKETLAAENSYGEAVSNYEEALSFYQISLAGLERAVGVPLTSIPEFR
ncbi:MAG: TolC family protein [Elusimicrobia bacterium]|nr:TolC family protein [Elusimicrobiota bacterium]